MTKKKSKSSGAGQAGTVGATGSPAKPGNDAELVDILPQFAFAFRSTLIPASYIPSTVLQILAVAYCIFLLPGRPASLIDPEALLANLIHDATSTIKIVIGGLIVVQLYFGGQAKRWWDAAQPTNVTASDANTGGKTVGEANAALQRKFDASVSQQRGPLQQLTWLASQELAEAIMTVALFAALLFILIILMGAPVGR